VDAPALRLRKPADVLAAIPYVMGYHPRDSVVVLAMRDTHLLFTAREDLPGADLGDLREQALMLQRLLRRERATAVLLVGFGPDDRVRPALLLLRDLCETAGVRVLELLRADDGRFWSYLCADPTCCPVDGSPYDPRSTAVAAQWTVAGRVALPDREAYERQLDPVTGDGRLAMAQATARAGDRFFELVTRPIDEATLEGEILAAAHTVLREALAGAPMDDDTVAWLTVLLASEPVRAVAWTQIGSATPELADELRSLWLDVMRRAEADLRAAPAAMFAYAAWQCGDSHLARVAVEQALALEPGFPQARDLRQALAQGRPPGDLEAEGYRRVSGRRGRRSRRRSSSRRAGSQRA
jgi:hypothetical protein